MQNQEFPRLINSTLLQSIWNFANWFGAKITHVVRKMSFSASAGKFKEISKNVFFGQKWHF